MIKELLNNKYFMYSLITIVAGIILLCIGVITIFILSLFSDFTSIIDNQQQLNACINNDYTDTNCEYCYNLINNN